MVGQLEAYGALKLFILSSGGRGVEVEVVEEGRREGGEEEEESEGSKCGKRWRNGGRVNCVYSAATEKSIGFLFGGRNKCSCFTMPCQAGFLSLTNLKISCSYAQYIRCSAM